MNFFFALFYDVCVLSLAIRDICHVSMAHGLFVLKVALNTDLINWADVILRTILHITISSEKHRNALYTGPPCI